MPKRRFVLKDRLAKIVQNSMIETHRPADSFTASVGEVEQCCFRAEDLYAEYKRAEDAWMAAEESAVAAHLNMLTPVERFDIQLWWQSIEVDEDGEFTLSIRYDGALNRTSNVDPCKIGGHPFYVEELFDLKVRAPRLAVPAPIVGLMNRAGLCIMISYRGRSRRLRPAVSAA